MNPVARRHSTKCRKLCKLFGARRALALLMFLSLREPVWADNFGNILKNEFAVVVIAVEPAGTGTLKADVAAVTVFDAPAVERSVTSAVSIIVTN
jgi:hypothetical protein